MNQPVSSLNLPSSITNKLENAGFHYCNEVKENLESINEQTNIMNWLSVMECPKPKSALDLLQEEQHFQCLTTSIQSLNPMLRSVLVAGTVTEFCGLPGTGKTQLCLSLAVGLKGEVVLIHTNKNLNSERLRDLCPQSQEMSIMNKIFCIEASNPTELLATVQYLQNWLPEHKYVRMVLIDSISWPLKQQPVSERCNFICTMLQNLRILANKNCLSIVLTNDLTTRVTKDKAYHTSCFGDSFYHLINNRILLSKENNTFSAEVLKSVNGLHSKISFKI